MSTKGLKCDRHSIKELEIVIKLYYKEQNTLENKWGIYKDYNMDRFGIYISSFKVMDTNRSRHRSLYQREVLDDFGLTLKDFPDYNLHHSATSFRLMLIPKCIHKVHHLGSIGLLKRNPNLFYAAIQ